MLPCVDDSEADVGVVAQALEEHLSSALAVMPASSIAAAAAARWMDLGDMPPTAAGSSSLSARWWEEDADKEGDEVGKLRTASEPLRQSSAAS